MHSAPRQLGVIFDMDGVLVDSTDAHFQAFKTFGERRGIPFSMEFFRTIFGLHNRAIFPLWMGASLTPQQVEEYAFEKESLYRELAPRYVKPLPGVIDFMKELHCSGFKLAIGSSGPRANVEVAQDILGCRELFSATVSGDDTAHGKPNPEIFLKAASKLDLPPSSCLVIEDALAGLEAAHAAKMKVVAISSSLPPNQLQSAHRVIGSFSEINPTDVRKLLS